MHIYVSNVYMYIYRCTKYFAQQMVNTYIIVESDYIEVKKTRIIIYNNYTTRINLNSMELPRTY